MSQEFPHIIGLSTMSRSEWKIKRYLWKVKAIPQFQFMRMRSNNGD